MACGRSRRTVSSCYNLLADTDSPQSYEVIGNPPNIAVPTHFAKVIMTSKSPATSSFGFGGSAKSVSPVAVSEAVKDVAIGAFVLPNAVIPDQVPLTSFQVPGKFVTTNESRMYGLTRSLTL